MEWLHFATKPSFLSVLDWFPSLTVLITSPLPIVALALVGTVPLALVDLLIRRRWLNTGLLAVARLIPALLLTALALVTADVFTKTVIGFGIADTTAHSLHWYVGLTGVLFILNYGYLAGLEEKSWVRSRESVIACGTAGLIVLSCLFLVGTRSAGLQLGQFDRKDPEIPRNVLLVSSDGLDADRMSVYGSERDTTPFLKELAAESLVCENALANAGPTGASIASLLSGKLPTQTRLIYPPDILRGRHAYQHLPFILGGAGYRSIHLSIRHYADAYDLNMRDSFDTSNFRMAERVQVPAVLGDWIGVESAYLIEHMIDRVQTRLEHVFGFSVMEDPFLEVQEEGTRYRRDNYLLSELIGFIDESKEPFFAHVHFLGTHGPRFRPRRQVFSAGQEQTETWMEDFFDDAILDFDSLLRELVDHLKATKRFEETLLVVHTDHAQFHRTDRRIPLIIRFPGQERVGVIRENAQLLDISPTVLDVLGIRRPAWMGGRSLLSDPVEAAEPIFSVGRIAAPVAREDKVVEIEEEFIQPPFFTLRFLRATICDRMYELDLKKTTVKEKPIPGHTLPCKPDLYPSRTKAADLLISHLSNQGYDVSSLQDLALAK